jgi:hypothetical protein
MNVFIKRAEGHEKDILRVPETGKNLLQEGEVVCWNGFWNQRLYAGIIIAGRDRVKNKSTKIKKKEKEKEVSKEEIT